MTRVPCYKNIFNQRYFKRILCLVACLLLASCEFDEKPTREHLNNTNLEAKTEKQGAKIGQDISTPISSVEAAKLQQGSHNIAYTDSGILIVANQANELSMLTALANRSNFELIDEGAPWEEVTITIQADNLHEVLDILLQKHTYKLVYTYNQ